MFHKNLNTVPTAVFASTPKTPQEEFRNLANLLANNQPMTLNPDGTPSGAGLPGHTGLSQNPGSSLGGQQNVQQTTADAKRFAGKGLPFSRPVVSSNHMDNVEFTVDNMIRVSPVGPNGETSVPAVEAQPAAPSSIGGQTNLSAATAERFAATPWYESNAQLYYNHDGESIPLHLTGKQLWSEEKKLMSIKYPQAQTGIMETTGELYWIVPVTIDLGFTTKRWTFMLKYDNNHPHADDFGGSVKAIPMIPSIDELECRAKDAGRTIGSNVSKCVHVPHIWKDHKDNMLYLCTVGTSSQAAGLQNGTIQSAAAVMGRAIRWAYYYEAGLLDNAVWTEFCKG